MLTDGLSLQRVSNELMPFNFSLTTPYKVNNNYLDDLL